MATARKKPAAKKRNPVPPLRSSQGIAPDMVGSLARKPATARRRNPLSPEDAAQVKTLRARIKELDREVLTAVDARNYTKADKLDRDRVKLWKMVDALEGVKRNHNPTPTRRKNPAHSPDTVKAAELYSKFTGHNPESLGKVKVNPLPKVAACIGTCDGILYTTVRDGVTEKYIHKFRAKDKPLFCVDPSGKQLLLVGGSYDFTERGIVDKSDPSR